MATSIWKTVAEVKSMEVVNDGQKHQVKTARYLDSLNAEILADETLMAAWAKEEGILHGLLCAGLRDDIIRQRAYTRKKDKDGTQVVITEKLFDEMQQSIRNHTPALLKKPGSSSKEAALTNAHRIAAESLWNATGDANQVRTMLKNMGVSETVVEDLMAELN